MQCRWGGHTRIFYSVAEHCVRASRLVPGQNTLWALLHDAAEAYLIDLPTPIKAQLSGYKAAEAAILREIASAYGLTLPTPQEVMYADAILKATEHRDLLGGPTPTGVERGLALTGRIKPWPQHEAKSRFLARFKILHKPQQR